MPTKRQLLPPTEVIFEIVWEPGGLGGAAQTVVDVLRLVNRLAGLKEKGSTPTAHWRWVRCDGRRVPEPAISQLPSVERPKGSAVRSPADVIVLPGWMARDGPEVERWIERSRGMMPRLQQTLERGGALLGVYSGVVLLAAAGCLQERRFAAPWPFFMSVMRNALAHDGSSSGSVDWSDTPTWTSDRGVWTCATPVATAEAVLDLLGSTPLADLASVARDVLIPAPLRQAAAVAHALSERRPTPSGMVERARRWLVHHLKEPYDIDALAQVAATSARTLARHFAATHAMSPHQYLERLRVEHACALLQTTYLTVEEVGRASGLPSPSTFRRVFHKHTGYLPANYRERYRLRTLRPRWASLLPH